MPNFQFIPKRGLINPLTVRTSNLLSKINVGLSFVNNSFVPLRETIIPVTELVCSNSVTP